MPFVEESVRLITLKAGAAIAKHRFVKSAGNGKVIQSAAEGDQTIGVSKSAAAADNDFIAVALQGCRVAIEAGGALTAGAAVETDSVGRAVAHGGAAARGLGYVEEAAGGAGEIVTLVYVPFISIT